MNTEHNPELYEQLNAPYEVEDDATAALDAFLEDVSTARKKHRIGNAVVIASARVKTDNYPRSVSAHFGNSNYVVPLLVSALQTQRRQYLEPLQAIDSQIRSICEPEDANSP